jgi:hypothetical protein
VERLSSAAGLIDYNISVKAKYAREYVCNRIDKKLGGKKKQA